MDTGACKIEWLTVPAPDLHAARAFYETVFGFSVTEFSDSFWVFKSGTVSGGFDASLQVNSAGTGIGFSITVPVMAASLQALIEAGGAIVKEAYSLGPGAGFCAQFADPNGNVLELYAEVLE